MSSKLQRHRYLVARRVTQALVVLLFVGANTWGWRVLIGNLSLSKVLDTVPLADPYATLQITAAGVVPTADVLLGAAITLVFYVLLAGRAFCAWVCPLNAVTDLANWLRDRLPLGDSGPRSSFSRSARFKVLLLSFVLSALLHVAAFEWISPVSMLHRGLVFGIGLGWLVVLAVFLFDLLYQRDGFCGHLCPLGGFYTLVTRLSLLRIKHDHENCTECGDCQNVCPEEPILAGIGRASGSVLAGECTNCGRCIDVCEVEALAFGIRGKSI